MCSLTKQQPSIQKVQLEADFYSEVDKVRELFQAPAQISLPAIVMFPQQSTSETHVTPRGDRYKTELCQKWEEFGVCSYGDRCQYAHGFEELRFVRRHPRYKTKVCHSFSMTGSCKYGKRCHFIHMKYTDQEPISVLEVKESNQCDSCASSETECSPALESVSSSTKSITSSNSGHISSTNAQPSDVLTPRRLPIFVELCEATSPPSQQVLSQ
eukprot:TRINITY_DN7089_c0_g2_i1.p4 TRINITY_DN7089_c0_g2~~TRINITY_DN7089_c0_g2_i1.p4  ORF type:complete len:213 (+),score=5.13 TRINITY_DN7089_c0_g2_i1:174-812(+)